jgi:hypothetical protein
MVEYVAMEALRLFLFFHPADPYLVDESSWRALYTSGS